jgi:ADP-glucose pyrophosphorylase
VYIRNIRITGKESGHNSHVLKVLRSSSKSLKKAGSFSSNNSNLKFKPKKRPKEEVCVKGNYVFKNELLKYVLLKHARAPPHEQDEKALG